MCLCIAPFFCVISFSLSPTTIPHLLLHPPPPPQYPSSRARRQDAVQFSCSQKMSPGQTDRKERDRYTTSTCVCALFRACGQKQPLCPWQYVYLMGKGHGKGLVILWIDEPKWQNDAMRPLREKKINCPWSSSSPPGWVRLRFLSIHLNVVLWLLRRHPLVTSG